MNVVTPLIAVLLGALALAVNRYLEGPQLFERIIIGVVILVIVLWVLSAFGLLDGLYIGRPGID